MTFSMISSAVLDQTKGLGSSLWPSMYLETNAQLREHGVDRPELDPAPLAIGVVAGQDNVLGQRPLPRTQAQD